MQVHTHRITLLVATTNADPNTVADTIESHVDTLGHGIIGARVTTRTHSSAANVPDQPTDSETVGEWAERHILPLIGIR